MRFNGLLFLSFSLAIAASAADDSKPVALQQTPPAVQKTIAAQIGDGTVGEIDRTDENGEPVFDVSFTAKTGAEHGFSVAGDGTLLSVEVAFPEAPAAVQKTIQTQAAGWSLNGIDKNVDEPDITFDVEVTKDGQTRNFTVDDDGTLLSIAVAMDETPAAVQRTIQAQAAGWTLDGIDKNVDDPDISYDVDATKDGQRKSFTVDQDGTLAGIEVPLAATPAPVQAAINRELAGGVLKSIDEDLDPDGNTFDVEGITKDGARRSFTVGANGWLMSEEVTLDQTPPAARATIQQQIGNGKILRIDQSLVEKRKKVLPYEVQGRKDGKPFDFSVGPKGKFLGMDD